jgi:protein involved in polysaccharide export with SLBB domain
MSAIGISQRAVFLALVFTLLTCLGAAQESSAPKPAAANPETSMSKASTYATGSPQLHARDSRYEIRAGDSFDVTFDLSPEFNQVGVTVQPDGFVTLRGVGDINVDGQTVPQLTQTLRAFGFAWAR